MVSAIRPITEPAVSAISSALISVIPLFRIVCDSAQHFPDRVWRVPVSGPQLRDRPLSESISFPLEDQCCLPRIFVERMPSWLQVLCLGSISASYLFPLLLDALRTGGHVYISSHVYSSFYMKNSGFWANSFCGTVWAKYIGRNRGSFFRQKYCNNESAAQCN